jgi:hypothetical protein
MFVRFRQTKYRLQASLVETRRADGKVKHEHVASLGSIETPQSIADRIAFWRKVHDRLAKQGNRIGPSMGAIIGALHERVPMPTPDEQREFQLQNARRDERFYGTVSEVHAEMVEGHKVLLSSIEKKIADGQAAAKATAERAATARQRIEQIERGEVVAGGLGRPLTYEDMVEVLKRSGFTASDIRHFQNVAALDESAFAEYVQECQRRLLRADEGRKQVARTLRKRHGRPPLKAP